MAMQAAPLHPLTDFDAWLIKCALEGLLYKEHYAKASAWLRDFIHSTDGFTAPGWKDQIKLILRADGLTAVHKQSHFSPPPTAPLTLLGEVATPYRLLTVAELHSQPRLTWLIPGEIPMRGLAVLYGASGAGKSFVALDYALQVSQSAPVLYYAGEGESGYSPRIKAWETHHGKMAGPGLRFVLGSLPLLDRTWSTQFLDLCRRYLPALVVVDTLARAMLGGDENSSRDMGLLIEACTNIVNEAQTAVLLVHHTNKTGSSERGSSALRGAADSMIELSNDDGLISVECSKSKDARQFEPRYLRLFEIPLAEGVSSCVVIPANRREMPVALSVRAKEVISALKMLPLSTGAKVSVLHTVTSISERSLYRILDKLMRQGYVEQTTKGDPYKLTETGSALQVD